MRMFITPRFDVTWFRRNAQQDKRLAEAINGCMLFICHTTAHWSRICLKVITFTMPLMGAHVLVV